MSPLPANLSDCCFRSFSLILGFPYPRYDLRQPVIELPPLPKSIQSRAKPCFLEPSPKSPNTSSNPIKFLSHTVLMRCLPVHQAQWIQLQLCSWQSLAGRHGPWYGNSAPYLIEPIGPFLFGNIRHWAGRGKVGDSNSGSNSVPEDIGIMQS